MHTMSQKKKKNRQQIRRDERSSSGNADAGRELLFSALEELRLKADYIAGLCDALILAQLTGDSAEHPETGEALARTMQRNLNGLYNLIEQAQDGLSWKAEKDPCTPSGGCQRLAAALETGDIL